MSKASCYELIRMYNSLKSSLFAVASNLDGGSNNMAPVGDVIAQVYNINDESTPIVSKCKSLTNDIAGISKDIRNLIIPAIDHAIRCLNSDIARMDAEEKAQAARR